MGLHFFTDQPSFPILAANAADSIFPIPYSLIPYDAFAARCRRASELPDGVEGYYRPILQHIKDGVFEVCSLTI